MGTTQPIKDKKDLIKFRNYYKHVENHPRNYALIVLGLNSALRIGDILVLRWSDVYNNNKKTYFPHISIIEEKTGKQNILAVNKAVIEALEYYRRCIEQFDIDNYIFTSQKAHNDHLSRCQAFRIIKHAATACGMSGDISCHSLRKTFGYYAWKNGFPPALLMKIYNHSSYEITKHYLCIDQQEKDEVYLRNFL